MLKNVIGGVWMISFIWAMDRNGLIGKENQLPWHLPADLAYFKKITVGSTIIMGRKTFEAIGRPLPKRNNIVLTTQTERIEGVTIVHSISELLNNISNEEECFVIGGALIFKELFPYASKLYITKIDEVFDGDIFFPAYNESEWKVVSKEVGEVDEKNKYPHTFFVYERMKG